MRVIILYVFKRTGPALCLLAVILTSCGDNSEAAPDGVTQVTSAARKTIRSGPASIFVSVSSPTVKYVIRGTIMFTDDSYRARTTVERAPRRPTSILRTVGARGAAYEVKGRCWLDPHAPVGSFGGATSVQETLTLLGVLLRLLRDATEEASTVDERMEGGTRFAVEVDERRAYVPHSVSARDEPWVTRPHRLGHHLDEPVALTVDGAGRVSRVHLELPRFAPVTRPPSTGRGGAEQVSIDVALTDTSRELDLGNPRCRVVE